MNESVNYGLYLCVMRITLDHNVIEGVGISPDKEVPFVPTAPFKDSQIETALDILSKK